MKKFSWKNGAQCAVMITVDLDAELFWLALSPDVVNRPKTMSMGQYGIKRGLGRVLDALDEFGIKATFFVPGRVAELYPEKLREVAACGHEIANHGYMHENFATLSQQEQKAAMQKGFAAIQKVCGTAPRGFRAPEGELTLQTLRLAKACGAVYSSNLCNDDRPYIKDIGGESIVEIPIHWELFDLPYFAFNYHPAFPKGQGRVANYTQVLNNWKEEYYAYRDEGLCYVLQIDPQTIGTPGRIELLRELLAEIRKDGNIWYATGSEMADFIQNGKAE